jgi:hypothetical protein
MGAYITNLAVLIDDEKPSTGWIKIDKDLNKGTGGKYLYFAYESGDDKSKAITDIMFLTGKNPPTPGGYTKIDVDLNKGAHGEFIWTYFIRDPEYGSPLTGLDVLIADDANAQPPQPWHRINQDLNKGAKGKYIYLTYNKNT